MITNEKFDTDEEYDSYIKNQSLIREDFNRIKNSILQTETNSDYLISKLNNLENELNYKRISTSIRINEKED
jgi:BMFP domain-containing protein YqiC